MYFRETTFLQRLSQGWSPKKLRPKIWDYLEKTLSSISRYCPRVLGDDATYRAENPKSGSRVFSRGGVGMNELVMLEGADCRKILQSVVDNRVSAIMSYLSKGKWHVAKVVLAGLGADRLRVEGTAFGRKPRPINIQINQPVGVSFKHGYGKFVFDTTVAGLEPSPEASGGGTIILAAPDRVGVVQRRSYFRVNVPESLKVNVVLWHRSSKPQARDAMETSAMCEPRHYYQGRLIDLSAGGAQVVVPLPCSAEVPSPEAPGAGTLAVEAQDFKKGQFIGLRFTPMPYETPLMFNAQIRNMLPAADHKSVFLCLQIVGLEASPEGRQVLSRLVEVVERYHQINQSSAKQQDMQRHSVSQRSAVLA
jgi:hypothetical protein